MSGGDAYVQLHPLLTGQLRRDFWQAIQIGLTHSSPFQILFLLLLFFEAPDLHGDSIEKLIIKNTQPKAILLPEGITFLQESKSQAEGINRLGRISRMSNAPISLFKKSC